MPMTYDEVQSDDRVSCHSREDAEGTVIRKFMGGEDGTTGYVEIEFDEGGFAFNYPQQLSRIAAPQPAAEVIA